MILPFSAGSRPVQEPAEANVPVRDLLGGYVMSFDAFIVGKIRYFSKRNVGAICRLLNQDYTEFRRGDVPC